MQNKIHKTEFSNRLRTLMIQRGHGSRTAVSGASPAALSKAIGCFTEMALRYLDGRSIPSPDVLLKIAEWLEVTPGYLLFGDSHHSNKAEDKNKITINKELLNYALKKTFYIISKTESENDKILDFLISILNDLSQMQIETEQLKQVFDLAIKSSIFNENNSTTGTKDREKLKWPSQATS